MQHHPKTDPAALSAFFIEVVHIPCAEGAKILLSSLKPSEYFSLALSTLLPVLEQSKSQTGDRIFAAYALYALYKPHPVSQNPFVSALRSAFQFWKEKASSDASLYGLVWTIWKLLCDQGDQVRLDSTGQDRLPELDAQVASYPPIELASEKLPFDFDMKSIEDNEFAVISGSDAVAEHLQEGGVDGHSDGQVSQDGAQPAKNSREHDLLRAACERVLTLSEQRFLQPLLFSLPLLPIVPSDLPSLVAHNAQIAHPVMVALLSASRTSSGDSAKATATLGFRPEEYLAALTHLPPSLPTYDLFGRLLRDTTPITLSDSSSTQNEDTSAQGRPNDTEPFIYVLSLNEVVCTYSLGPFLTNGINTIDKEADEGASDERLALAVRHMSRFALSLLRAGILKPSDPACAELAHFALRAARFDDARILYGALIQGQMSGG